MTKTEGRGRITRADVSLGVGVAGITACIVMFAMNQRLEVERTRCEVEKTKQEAKIEDLTRRMSSIDRGVGEKSSVFDLRERLVNPDKIRLLSTKLKYYPTNRFYVDENGLKKWEHRVSDEQKFNTRPDSAAIHFLRKYGGGSEWILLARIDMWYDPDASQYFPLEMIGSDKKRKTEAALLPCVMLSRVNYYESKALLDEVFALRSRLERDSVGIREKFSDSTKTELLREMFDPSISGAVIANHIDNGMQTARMLKNGEYKVVSIQKVANAVYMRTQLTFDNTYGTRKGRIVLDSEVFAMMADKDLIVISTYVPSVDGRSDSYAWITDWLNRLYILTS